MKKTILLLVVLMVSVAMLFAAGGTEQKEVKPVKLEVWYAMSGASGEAFVKVANAFDEARDDIELELTYSGSYADTSTKVSAAMLSGTYPDVAIMGAGQLYTGGRGNFDMEKFVQDKDFNLDDIFPGMIEYSKYEGGISAVPYGISTQVMYYNKDIFKAAGIDIENNPPKTWDEFLAMAKKAQKDGNVNNSADFYGFDTSDNVWLFKSMLAQNGNEVVVKQADGTVLPVFNNAQGVKVAEFWKKLIDEGIMPAGQHSNAENKFLSGNIAFIAASSNRVQRWAGNTGFELGAIEMPMFTTPSLALGGNVGVILTQDKNKVDQAWDLIKWLLDEPNQTGFALATGYLPVRQSSKQNPAVEAEVAKNELYKVAMKQLDYTWAYYHFEQMGTMDNYFWYAMDEIEKNVKTPAKALDDAVTGLLKEME